VQLDQHTTSPPAASCRKLHPYKEDEHAGPKLAPTRIHLASRVPPLQKGVAARLIVKSPELRPLDAEHALAAARAPLARAHRVTMPLARASGACFRSGREMETGPADFLHAYWMGRYYGFLQ
jgi:hypothetical protein